MTAYESWSGGYGVQGESGPFGIDPPAPCEPCDGTGFTAEFDNPRPGVVCQECDGEGVS